MISNENFQKKNGKTFFYYLCAKFSLKTFKSLKLHKKNKLNSFMNLFYHKRISNRATQKIMNKAIYDLSILSSEPLESIEKFIRGWGKNFHFAQRWKFSFFVVDKNIEIKNIFLLTKKKKKRLLSRVCLEALLVRKDFSGFVKHWRVFQNSSILWRLTKFSDISLSFQLLGSIRPSLTFFCMCCLRFSNSPFRFIHSKQHKTHVWNVITKELSQNPSQLNSPWLNFIWKTANVLWHCYSTSFLSYHIFDSIHRLRKSNLKLSPADHWAINY